MLPEPFRVIFDVFHQARGGGPPSVSHSFPGGPQYSRYIGIGIRFDIGFNIGTTYCQYIGILVYVG